MKRLVSNFAILLALPFVLAVCLLLLPVQADAATEGYLGYEIGGGKATIFDCNTAATGELVIPDTLGGCPVTGIGWSAFDNCSNLTSITIPDTVTSIGDRAFYNCSSLTSITIPDSVTSIGWYAFQNCSSLTSIILPEGVTSIGSSAFSNCSSLTSIILPEGVTSIGEQAFYNCSSLTSITIPDTVTSIGYSAFYKCSSLTSITIPDSVTSIDDFAFSDCSSLTSIAIPDSVTSIGSSAFSNCSSLTSITIPDSVTSINYAAFHGCSSLTSITIPDSVTSIGRAAFSNCSSLTSIILPEGVTSIGDAAFSGCSNLTSVTIPDGVTSIGISAFDHCSSLTSVTIGDGVTSIGRAAFSDCSSLTSIAFPEGITSISERAFYNCSSLTDIHIISLESWLNISFADGYASPLHANGNAKKLCLNGQLLTDVVIPDGITTIGKYVFSYCSSLTSITIPDSVTSIGGSVFQSCSSLTSVAIPDSVTSIGDFAFSCCSSLTSIILPEGVTSIGEQAFYNCSSLTSITIPDSVTSINYAAFHGCSSLTSITIPGSVTSIDDFAFSDCSSLTSIAIPDSVTSIDYGAFNSCYRLTHVSYGGTAAQWESISLGSNNSYLTGAAAFHYKAEDNTYWTKNCVNSGIFCALCNDFVIREKAESGEHAYSDVADTLCDDCGYVRTAKTISLSQLPDVTEYALFEGILDVTGGVLSVTYSDGTTGKAEMTEEMVSGFDNTKPGVQTLTVTYGNATTSYTVEIIFGDPISMTVKTLPSTTGYIVGDQLNLTGLVLTGDFGQGLQAELTHADVTADAVDMTTAGVKTVTVRRGNAFAEFCVYVHEKETVTVDSSLYPESAHNYSSNANESKTFTYPGAGSLTLTFSSSSYTESNWDFVYIYDGSSAQIAKYSGDLSGKTVTVSGDSFTVKLTSDSSVNKYGYAFSSIVAETILHPANISPAVPPTCTQTGATEGSSCTICGEVLAQQEVLPALGHNYTNGACTRCSASAAQVLVNGSWQYADTVTQALATGAGGYAQLRGDLVEDVTVTADAFLDLNSFDLTGDITVAQGATLYLFDSATSDYTAANRGKIIGSITGNIARSFNTPESYGHNYKYMVLQEADGSWSSHRYYLSVRSVVLVPYMIGEGYTGTALNYKTAFKCNELVADAVAAYGTKFTGENTVYADCLPDLDGLQAGIANECKTWLAGAMKSTNSPEQNAANALLAPEACAFITLTDGTELCSSAVAYSLRDAIAAASAAESLTSLQQQVLGEMYKLFRSVLDTWEDVDLSVLRRYAGVAE